MNDRKRNRSRPVDEREVLARRGETSALVTGGVLILLGLTLLYIGDVLTPLTVLAVMISVFFVTSVVVAAIAFYSKWVSQNRYAGPPTVQEYRMSMDDDVTRSREAPPQLPRFPEQEQPGHHDRP